MTLSVIVCTRNPRPAPWARTLAALRGQTLPLADWELLVVDNASRPPLTSGPVAWHPRGRILTEPEPGLMAARLCGLAAATGELIVFVDDDNVLAPDYLATARDLAQREPALGAFGGSLIGEFEVPPPAWLASRLDRLAACPITAPSRTRQPDTALAPRGAGLCVRAAVVREFRVRVERDPRLRRLGWGGRQPVSGDDTALSLTACDLGLEMGLCPELQLTHLIPADRLTLRYLARVTCAHARGQLALLEIRGEADTRAASVRAARRALRKWTLISALASCLPRA